MIRKIISGLMAVCVIAALLSLLAGVVKLPKNVNFLDLPDDWAKEQLAMAYDNGITVRFDGNPKYSDPMTRLQFAQLLVNMVEKVTKSTLPLSPETTFSDTKNAAALKADAAGIITAANGSAFSPKTTVTYEDMAVMVYHAVRYIEKSTGKTYLVRNNDVSMYKDGAEISLWAKDAVGILTNSRFLDFGNPYFIPQQELYVENGIVIVNLIYNALSGLK